MKQPRKLNREEKIFLSKKKLNPDNWMVQYKDNDKIVIINKLSKKTRNFCIN